MMSLETNTTLRAEYRSIDSHYLLPNSNIIWKYAVFVKFYSHGYASNEN